MRYTPHSTGWGALTITYSSIVSMHDQFQYSYHPPPWLENYSVSKSDLYTWPLIFNKRGKLGFQTISYAEALRGIFRGGQIIPVPHLFLSQVLS